MSDKPDKAKIDFDAAPPMQVTQYDNMIGRFVPGYEVIFQLALAHFRTKLASNARLLVVGAGSGKELVTFGQAEPGWTLTGVDPSAHMLAIAREKLDRYDLAGRVTLQPGLVEHLPATAQFEAATCILVMHFLPDDGAKLALLTSIATRLKGGASFILVDGVGTPEQIKASNAVWVQHAAQMGLSSAAMQNLVKVQDELHTVTESRSQQLLAQAGFENISRFYSALFYSGWWATRRAE